MVKVIKIQDANYAKLLEILHKIEKERNQRMSFDDVISYLISLHEDVRQKFISGKKSNKVTR